MRSRTISMAVAATVLTTIGASAALATTEPPETTGAEGTAAGSTEPAGTIPDPAACAEGLTLEEGVLTVATGEPAFPPYVIDDDPTSGEGFESAVAYAVALELGFDEEDVEWVRTGFDAAIQPGPKDFDVNIQQYSITPEREEVASFSLPYYTSNHALVAFADSPAAGATTLPALQELTIGVASGTSSLQFVEDVLQPASSPQVFNDNASVVQAMTTQQIDAIVVDLPTALYLTAVELEDAVVVGQFPPVDTAEGEPWGMLLEKDNPLKECVDYAILRLRQSGQLDEITTTWMEEATEVPLIDLE
jgi:polar amino acid transport system substrate-binding protein